MAVSVPDGGAPRRGRPRGTLNQARFEEVMQAAADVFSEKGYVAATLQDIATRVGMLKGSLYYYIESKEDLLYELLRRAHLQGVSFVVEDPETAASDPPSRIADLIRRWLLGVWSLPSPLRITEYEFDHRYLEPKRRAEILSMRRHITQSVQDIIDAGIRDGSFHHSVDPYAAACTLLRVVNTTGRWYRPGGSVTWEQATDWIVGLFLGGLAHGPAPAEAGSPDPSSKRSLSPL